MVGNMSSTYHHSIHHSPYKMKGVLAWQVYRLTITKKGQKSLSIKLTINPCGLIKHTTKLKLCTAT